MPKTTTEHYIYNGFSLYIHMLKISLYVRHSKKNSYNKIEKQ